MTIEICTANLQSALNAQAAGADRIELCSHLGLGGTTPSAGLIRMACQSLHLPVQVLIRPRGGDFCYTQSELEVMRQDIRFCKAAGAKGVVIGVLNPDATIALSQMRHLVDLARPMEVTFHRAFDQTAEPVERLEELLRLGVDRLLTSGQKATAWEGRHLIRELVAQAGSRLTVMPGSGISADNLLQLREETGAMEFHLSARKRVASAFDASLTDLHFSPCTELPAFDRYESDPELLARVMALAH